MSIFLLAWTFWSLGVAPRRNRNSYTGAEIARKSSQIGLLDQIHPLRDGMWCIPQNHRSHMVYSTESPLGIMLSPHSHITKEQALQLREDEDFSTIVNNTLEEADSQLQDAWAIEDIDALWALISAKFESVIHRGLVNQGSIDSKCLHSRLFCSHS